MNRIDWAAVGFGTATGIVLITVGLILAVWHAAVVPEYSPLTNVYGQAHAVRGALEIALRWTQRGMLVILVAEVARRSVRRYGARV